MALDVHPLIRDQLRDPAIPLWITEGIFKADAAISTGLCCVAVLGVWNWRGTNELGGKTALADWEAVALNGRTVYLVFDSDVMLNPQVYQALARLGAFLASRKAHVHYVYLPAGLGGTKSAWTTTWPPATRRRSSWLGRNRTAPTAVWCGRGNRTIRRDRRRHHLAQVGRGRLIDVHLANFGAFIVDDVVVDDGAEERRVFVVEATVRDTRHHIDIPAAQFAGMAWVGERLGASAVLEPGLGTKDRFRHAVQTLSGEIPQRRVYAHTGWRLINGIWVYLHGAGAMGPEGPIFGVEVGLRGPVARMTLPDPPGDEALIKTVIGAALKLLNLLPPEIAYPLVGGVFFFGAIARAARTGRAWLVVWYHGPSGCFKSELLALAQGFYGDFTRQTLPVTFSATANARERFLFEAKDTLLAVDDFHPAGDVREQQAMNQVANRLLRGAGNQAGRARMRADTTLRPTLNPRCLAIASGERLPEGHSTTARMFSVAVAPGAIEQRQLTVAQEQRHHYPYALAIYLRSLAEQFAVLQEQTLSDFGSCAAELQAWWRRRGGGVAGGGVGVSNEVGRG